jgi:hypothetical protein
LIKENKSFKDELKMLRLEKEELERRIHQIAPKNAFKTESNHENESQVITKR